MKALHLEYGLPFRKDFLTIGGWVDMKGEFWALHV